MSSENDMNKSTLVELEAKENTFLVPAVTHETAQSTDKTVGHGNVVDPGHVFDRDVLIATFAIASTDTKNVNLTGDFDLWHEYLASPQIVAYCSSFKQLSCDLIVTCRMIGPGSCYGVYNIQALCDGGPVLAGTEQDGATVDDYHNSTQDVHGFMNVDLRNDVVFELPWESNLDSIIINPLTAEIKCWRLLIWALAPIQNTLSATVAQGTIQVYARMGKKRNFENLYYQSGELEYQTGKVKYPTEKAKPSAIGSKVAAGVAMVGGVPCYCSLGGARGCCFSWIEQCSCFLWLYQRECTRGPDYYG